MHDGITIEVVYLARNTRICAWGFSHTGVVQVLISFKSNLYSFVLKSRILCTYLQDFLTAFMSSPRTCMSSPRSTSEVWRESNSPVPIPMAPKQIRSASSKKLPPTPPKKSSLKKTVTNENQSYSPSLVQFSCQPKRPRFASDFFSIVRLTLIAATVAGIPLGVIRARTAELTHLHFNVLKLGFVCAFLISLFSIVGPADVSQNSLHSLSCCPCWILYGSSTASYHIE